MGRRRKAEDPPKWVYVQVEGGCSIAEVLSVDSVEARLRIPHWKGETYNFTLPIEVFRECPIYS